MTSIFISYKREDEPRAGALVRAIEAEGLSVWWDRGLPGGEDWRANIENALNDAHCVLVLWTRASVGPEGGFVRDEASRAKSRNILVPVRMEPVNAPLGFGEIQAIDLAHWRGSRSDPFFKDLVAAVRAKLEGRDAPPAKGPVIRLYRRLAASATLATTIAAVWGFGMNALGVQDQLCRIPGGQPFVSDACGSMGLGHAPSQAERLAWEERPVGDCEALRGFASHPGHYQSIAADMLAATTLERAETYTPAPRDWRSYVRSSERPFATEGAARADALARAEADAEAQGCAPRDGFERLEGVDLLAYDYDCRSDSRGGYACGLDYTAGCRISERALIERCG